MTIASASLDPSRTRRCVHVFSNLEPQTRNRAFGAAPGTASASACERTFCPLFLNSPPMRNSCALLQTTHTRTRFLHPLSALRAATQLNDGVDLATVNSLGDVLSCCTACVNNLNCEGFVVLGGTCYLKGCNSGNVGTSCFRQDAMTSRTAYMLVMISADPRSRNDE